MGLKPPTGALREKREEVLRDVLKWLDEGRIQAETGSYVIWESNYHTVYDVLSESQYEADLQHFLKNHWDAPCTVCAKGAVFLSYVYHHDKVELEKTYHNSEVTDAVRDLFPQWEMDLMECAFEEQMTHFRDVAEDYVDDPEELWDWVAEFYRAGDMEDGVDYRSDSDQLRVIINYTLEHGMFAPTEFEFYAEWMSQEAQGGTPSQEGTPSEPPAT